MSLSYAARTLRRRVAWEGRLSACVPLLILSVALSAARGEDGKQPTTPPKVLDATDLDRALILALRTGEPERLAPFVGAAQDYRPPPGHSRPGIQYVPPDAEKQAAEWARDRQRALVNNLRSVREFGTRQGIDWAKAGIRQVPGLVGHAIFEVYSRPHAISVIVYTSVGVGKRPILGDIWRKTLLSAEELDRLRRWKPGAKREEDLAIGRILIRKSADESVLRYAGQVPHDKFQESQSIATTIQLPKSFDKNRPDTIRLLQFSSEQFEGADSKSNTLVETGNDTLDFQGSVVLFANFDIPLTIVLNDDGVASRDSFSATSVFGRVQDFSRVKGSERTFRSPTVAVWMLGAGGPGVTLTLRDDVIVSVEPGLPTLLSAEEIERVRRWQPGVKPEEDQALRQILVRKSVKDAILEFCGVYQKVRSGGWQAGSGGYTVRVPPSFDPRRRDAVRLVDAGLTLTETGDDTLEFQGGRESYSLKFVLKDRDIAKRDSWSATVNGVAHVFSRVRGTERAFRSPVVRTQILNAQDGDRGVILTLHDDVIVRVRPRP